MIAYDRIAALMAAHQHPSAPEPASDDTASPNAASE